MTAAEPRVGALLVLLFYASWIRRALVSLAAPAQERFDALNQSPAAFNAGMAPTKFYRYDFVAGGADVTGRLEQAGARAALQEAARLHVVAPDQPLDQSARQAVVAAGDLYEQRFGTELERVRVVTHPRIFDFDHGGLIDAPPPPPATLELATGEFD